MICPNCGGSNVTVQMVTETELKNKHHGVLWWIFVGIWWVPVKWIIFAIPALLGKIFGSKRQKIVQTTRKMCLCQSCGHSWEIK